MPNFSSLAIHVRIPQSHRFIKLKITGGHDISVYYINDTKLATPGTLERRKLYPACLPSVLHKDDRGIFAAWKDPADLGEYYPENDIYSLNSSVDAYRQEQLILRHIGVRNITCQDPQWMNSNTYYPRGL